MVLPLGFQTNANNPLANKAKRPFSQRTVILKGVKRNPEIFQRIKVRTKYSTMRILFFIDGLPAGGKERRFVELLRNLHNLEDVQIEIALMSPIIEYDGIFEIDVPLHFLIRSWKWDPRIFVELFRLCRRFKPDIMHVWGPMTAFYAAPLAALGRFRLVNGMVTDARRLSILDKTYWLARTTFIFSDRIVANSIAGLKSYKVPEHKGSVIYNGFNFDRLLNLQQQNDIRKQFGLVTPIIVGMVAGFGERKDYVTLIHSALRILKTRQDVSFLFVGDGPNIDACKKLVPDSMTSRIIFTGKQRDIESIVSTFTVGVLLTNNNVHREGISNSILEYMALAKPVVATEGGGTVEIVENNRTGIVVQNGDVDGVVRAIEYLLANPRIAKKYGEMGRNRVQAEFSIEAMSDRYYTLYKTLLKDDH